MQTDYVFNTFSDEEIREIAQALQESDATGRGSTVSEIELQEIISALQETTVSFTQSKKSTSDPVVNIAVLGESGSGKSTFINVIRGLDDDEIDGAAKTGVVETTKYPTAYPHPKYKNVLFWDHPGSGTPGFDSDSYLKIVNVHQYNFFIIVASARVRQNDMDLAKGLCSLGKKFFFVRNKIDSDLKASKRRRRKTYNEDSILTDVRVNCMKHLMDCGIRLPCVFLLSCLELEKYDFHLLKKTLEKEVIRNISEMDLSEPFEIISDEEAEEIRTALKEGDLCKASEKASQSLKDIENAPLNIAVTGESGSGKSTFVNVIRGLVDDEEEGAATTGVTETTMEPKAYPHPQYNNVTIWDLPGIGSPSFNPSKYLKAVGFDRYDFFIIMSSERFRHNDMELAKAIESMGKKFYFVRSKVDSDMHASQIRRKKSYNEENILKKIRDDCIKCLHDGEIHDAKVFLFSSLELHKYDFNKMQETLEQELPSQKRYVFMLCLPNISLPILKKKRDALRKQIWKLASLSCAVATVPLPGLSVACDIGILVTEMKKYRDAFGLDPNSLEKLANRFDKDVDELKSVIKSPIVVKEINKELVTTLLTRGAAGSLMFVEYLASNIPVVGTMAAGGISFGTTYYMLYYFLQDIAEDAMRVLQKALDSPV